MTYQNYLFKGAAGGSKTKMVADTWSWNKTSPVNLSTCLEKELALIIHQCKTNGWVTNSDRTNLNVFSIVLDPALNLKVYLIRALEVTEITLFFAFCDKFPNWSVWWPDGFLCIFTLAFHLFLAPAGGVNSAGPIF